MSDEPRWQFWIDVGGTFTDCYAVDPRGNISRCKVLSSGATKGIASVGGCGCLTDMARRRDPDEFWKGYDLRTLDRTGYVVEQTAITSFDRATGELKFSRGVNVAAGQSYELVSDEEAPILAIRYLLELRRDQTLPNVDVRLGTTRGTNALLTRRGAKTAFVTTRGFGDILHIGNQNRPHLFELDIKKPTPLFSSVVEIDERVTHDGQILQPLDIDAAQKSLARLKDEGVESIAICLLNAYAFHDHESKLEALARELGFAEVSVSHRIAPLIKLVSRGDTTVVNAYLNPVLRDYVLRLRNSLGEDSNLRLMTSAGGLVEASHFHGKDSILSGPAGGVVGFSRVAEAAGFDRAIGFDMGGTSTDVARYDGRFEIEHETEKAGVRVVAPMLAIETVAAGGGSICSFDGVKLVVGPDSAGADPGPACYGSGGPLTVTDVNFYLGRLLPEHFPFPLDREAVEIELTRLQADVEIGSGKRLELVEIAAGFLQVANAKMSAAIRSISIAKGYDPRDYLLVAFGGAAAQHACAVATELGIESILNHPDAGILSAVGMGLADVTRHRAIGIYQPDTAENVDAVRTTLANLADEATTEVLKQGVRAEHINVRRSLDLRYVGTDATLSVDEVSSGSYIDAFQLAHRRLYGYVHDDRQLEIVAARVVATGKSDHKLPTCQTTAAPRVRRSQETCSMFVHDSFRDVDLFHRHELVAGDRVTGPAIIVESHSTTVIDAGWRADVLTQGELLLRREGDSSAVDGLDQTLSLRRTHDADPILLEIFNNQFAAIAEQMGVTLRNTSSSVNVKERLDYSCALFTADGDLVVNAPHIPVHLGAMSETVCCVLADNPTMRDGDVFVTNDPYRGGSHLPDVTVVTPVFDTAGHELLFLTASRAHHAEIGGMTPGSMPPFSTSLAEEGVLIRNLKVVDSGTSQMAELRRLLLAGEHPTRDVETNLADISAQMAANQQGVRDLSGLVDRYGLEMVQAYMRHIQDAAATKTRVAIAALPDDRRSFVDHLDDGSPISVVLTIDDDRVTIDFTGTGSVLSGNLNANRAIVTAAVMYVMRLLIDEDIPLNEGVLAPVEIILPDCLLNPPDLGDASLCAAVVGGNVETSQRVVDVLLGAFRLAAASQGTMNNVLFGDETFGYYETICGGAGATSNASGADAVHTHMTNTRLTDPEVIEQRFPVRLVEFSIRGGSGGSGTYLGGDGVVRRIEFLKDLELSIISQRRGNYAPYGLDGGGGGSLGENELQRADGTIEVLGSQTNVNVQPGDVLTIKTPGGGGWGRNE